MSQDPKSQEASAAPEIDLEDYMQPDSPKKRRRSGMGEMRREAKEKDDARRRRYEYKQALKDLEPHAMRVLAGILRSGKVTDPVVKLRAAQEVFDRIHGKANQPIETSDLAKRLQAMSEVELIAFVRTLLGDAGLDEKVMVLEVRDEDKVGMEARDPADPQVRVGEEVALDGEDR